MSAPPTGRLGEGTYRLQLRPGFGFEDVAALAGYLARLGVGLAYLSPVAEAVPGSTHGYDGTDPTCVRQELGGRPAFDHLVEALRQHGLGIVLDIVPNHLATWPGGRWWRSVLEEGERSEYAPVFDISWERSGGKVVLPVLAAPLEDVLSGASAPALELRRVAGKTVLGYGDLELPLATGTAPAEPIGTEAVSDVLDAQHYSLAFWRDQGARNYRRFFDIDGLVGVRVEDEAVFERTHVLYAELVHTGAIDALRVDHVDGLADPEEYLARLRELVGGLPIVVEKILGRSELLPPSWPVAGTTGYEIVDDVSGALVDPDGLDRLRTEAASRGERAVPEVVAESKRLAAETLFSAELGEAASLLELRLEDLESVAVSLPVYRTYGSARGMPPESVAVLRDAVSSAGGGSGGNDRLVESLADVSGHREGVVRFQQVSGPIAAKGVEDTAFYRLVGPLPFLEVGGDPARDRHDGLERYHERVAERGAAGVTSLAPGTTHDTKRSEDVRCRLLAVAEMPEEIESGLDRLAALTEPRRVDGLDVPSSLELRHLALTALAVTPLDGVGWEELPRRLSLVVRKGAREAKLHTSWTDPHLHYEEALVAAARSLVENEGSLLREAFGALVDDVARHGATLSLSALMLRRLSSAALDTYEGDETWNFSLVDPDNRRPVPFAALAAALDRLDAVLTRGEIAPAALLRRRWREGLVKLHVLRQALFAGHLAPAAFAASAEHRLLVPEGPQRASVVAAARIGKSPSAGRPQVALTFVTRFPSRLGAGPDDLPSGGHSYSSTHVGLEEDVLAALGGRRVFDALSGRVLGAKPPSRDRAELACAEVFDELPVALLLDEESAGPLLARAPS